MRGISCYLCVDVSVVLLLIKMNIFLTQVILFFILLLDLWEICAGLVMYDPFQKEKINVSGTH
jgi:hypothetical protein